jgi:hypothetical protein
MEERERQARAQGEQKESAGECSRGKEGGISI